MVDKPNPTPGSGPEIPGQGTPPAGQTPAPQQAGEGREFLTRAEFEAAMQRFQSSMGRKQADFTQKMQGDLTALKQHLDLIKASGVQVTPEQEQTMRNEVIARGFETPQATPGEQAAQPPPEYVPGEDYEEPPDPVTAMAWDMMEEAGVYIHEEDPEVQLLDKSGDPQAFLASVKPAMEAKMKRLLGGPQAPAPHAPTNLGGTGTPTNEYFGKIVDPDQIWRDLNKSP